MKVAIMSLLMTALAFSSPVFGLPGCSPPVEKGPERQAESAEPQRSIEQPPKAERITGEEYRKAELEMNEGSRGFIDEPQSPFIEGKLYEYNYLKDGIVIGDADLQLERDPEDGYIALFNFSLNENNGEMPQRREHIRFDTDKQLRIERYTLSSPGDNPRERKFKSIDFTVDREMIDISSSSRGHAGAVNTLPAPGGDVWPLIKYDLFTAALIIACIDPEAEKAVTWVLDPIDEKLQRLTVTCAGDDVIVDEESGMARSVGKFEMTPDEGGVEYYFVDSDGLLIAAEFGDGYTAELAPVAGSSTRE